MRCTAGRECGRLQITDKGFGPEQMRNVVGLQAAFFSEAYVSHEPSGSRSIRFLIGCNFPRKHSQDPQPDSPLFGLRHQTPAVSYHTFSWLARHIVLYSP